MLEENGFQCENCGRQVLFSKFIGTKHRNHCPVCLWSKHVDLKKSGDRLAECRGGMKPIGLTFKKEGRDKYGKIKQGELMLVHECQGCGRISVNRIAGDDDPKAVLGVLAESQKLNKDKKESLTASGIVLVAKEEEEKVMVQLFGKK